MTTAIVRAEYEDPKDGTRAVSFLVSDEIEMPVWEQVHRIAQFVPDATWTVEPGDDITGLAR